MISFLKKIKETNSIEDINNHDKAVLITSLMIECANVDGSFSSNEKFLIKNILKNKLHLDDDQAENCFSESIVSSDKSVEIYSLTKEIRDNFSKDEILIIFQYLWEVILSDNVIDDFEASMMTKLTGLFHLTGKENAEARKNAKESLTKKV